jgi:hypothetical protein
VVFIPKPGKSLSLRPTSLVSFVLKILEKLLDRHIRGGVLVEKTLHWNQFAYRAVCPRKRLISRSYTDWEIR